jgi:hypothetical protein
MRAFFNGARAFSIADILFYFYRCSIPRKKVDFFFLYLFIPFVRFVSFGGVAVPSEFGFPRKLEIQSV